MSLMGDLYQINEREISFFQTVIADSHIDLTGPIFFKKSQPKKLYVTVSLEGRVVATNHV